MVTKEWAGGPAHMYSHIEGGFFGIGGDKRTTGEERRLGILSFLGDRSRKLDDAPDDDDW